MSTWVIIHLSIPIGGEPTERAPEEWVSLTDHGVRIEWKDAGHSLIPWHNVLRIDHQPQAGEEPSQWRSSQ